MQEFMDLLMMILKSIELVRKGLVLFISRILVYLEIGNILMPLSRELLLVQLVWNFILQDVRDKESV